MTSNPLDEWTSDYNAMGGDEEWGTTNGTGTLAVVGLGLGKPTPLLARKLIYGGGQYIFSAEAKPGQLFMWDAETGDVQHIVDPTSLDGVKKLIAADEMNKIKYEDIPVAPTVEEREAHHETFFAAQGLTHMLRKE